MSNIILIVIIIFVVSLMLVLVSKTNKKGKAEKKEREAIRHEEGKKVIGPERKLHEEEKKRWENEYYKRH